jgi:hypothetical protein
MRRGSRPGAILGVADSTTQVLHVGGCAGCLPHVLAPPNEPRVPEVMQKEPEPSMQKPALTTQVFSQN